MAKLYGEIAKNALLTLDKSFSRALGQPLDASEVYYSLEAAQTYAATPAAYIGQKIVVIEDGVITHYSVEDTEGTLKELGSKPVADGLTVTILDDGKIALANLPEVEKDESGNDIPATYNAVLVNGELTWVKPSATTVEGLNDLITALTGRVDTLEGKVGKAAEGETAATGLYKLIADEETRATTAEGALEDRIEVLEGKEDKDTTYSVKEGEKVLSLDGTTFGTTLSIKYVGNEIQLCGIGDEVISKFDASAFTADGVLEDASYDADKKEITFTWNIVTGTDEEGQPIYKTDVVAIGDLVDTYTASNGLSLENNQFSIVVPTDDKYLTVDATGVHTKDIDTAISSAIEASAEELRTSITGVQTYAEGVADNLNIVDERVTELEDTTIPGLENRIKAIEDDYITSGELSTTIGVPGTPAEKDEEGNTTVVAVPGTGIYSNTYSKAEINALLDEIEGGSTESAASVARDLAAYISTNNERVGAIETEQDAQDTAIAAAQTQADKGVADAAKAQAAAEQVGNNLSLA